MMVSHKACTARTDYSLSRKTSGIQLGEDHANDVLGWYARRGDVLGLEDFLQTFVKGVVFHASKCLDLHTRLRFIDRPPTPFTHQSA
jgi:hypothetical protein